MKPRVWLLVVSVGLALELIELVAILVLYHIQTDPLMSPPMKTIIRVVIQLVIVLWLLRLFVGDIAIPSLR